MKELFINKNSLKGNQNRRKKNLKRSIKNNVNIAKDQRVKTHNKINIVSVTSKTKTNLKKKERKINKGQDQDLRKRKNIEEENHKVHSQKKEKSTEKDKNIKIIQGTKILKKGMRSIIMKEAKRIVIIVKVIDNYKNIASFYHHLIKGSF